MNFSRKLIEPKEGVIGTPDLSIASPSETQVTIWTCGWSLKLEAGL